MFHPWHDWYYRGTIATPYATRQELTAAGITPARVREVVAMLHPKLPPEKRRKKYTAIGEQLIRDLDPDFLPRIRSKLQRWRLPAYPWLLAERAYRILQAAFALTPPRVAQAYFSLLWSGLTTGRRFERRERCVICGGDSTEDSLEHYFCPVMRRVATEVFSLQDVDPENPRPKHFFQSGMLLSRGFSISTICIRCRAYLVVRGPSSLRGKWWTGRVLFYPAAHTGAPRATRSPFSSSRPRAYLPPRARVVPE